MGKKNVLFYMIFLLFVLFLSCNPIKNKSSSKKIKNIINYNKIDLYPVLPECSKIKLKLQQVCFYQAVSKRIQQNIDIKNSLFSTNIKDSISVSFIVDTLGVATVTSINHHYSSNKIKTLDSIIEIGFRSLPKMKPAIKMGIPVKAQFIIPIIINP